MVLGLLASFARVALVIDAHKHRQPVKPKSLAPFASGRPWEDVARIATTL